MVSTFNIEVYKKVHFLSVIIKRFSKHDFEKKILSNVMHIIKKSFNNVQVIRQFQMKSPYL